MINPKCWICGDELNKPGGIYFEPPYEVVGLPHTETCYKHHLCKECDVWLKTIVKVRKNEGRKED